MPRCGLKAFFGFTRHPFPPSCPPEPLFRFPALDAALDQATNALGSRMHVLITAPPGLGKSSFLRILEGALNPRDLRPVRMTGQGVGSCEVVNKLAEELGLESSSRRAQAVKLLAAGLRRMAASGPLPVLLIDEAQKLPVDAIDLVRLVAEESTPPLVALVLAGDDTLRRTLGRPAHAPLAGRLAARIRLNPFSDGETEAFVAHAFKTAGMQNVLAPTALASVHAAAGGAPRAIGAILARGLERALAKQSRLLTDEIVQEVLDERDR